MFAVPSSSSAEQLADIFGHFQHTSSLFLRIKSTVRYERDPEEHAETLV